MNIVTLASRKGGAGKSTLTAHLAAHAAAQGRRCMVIDADPQGSLSLWHSLRSTPEPALRSAARGIDGIVAMAMLDGYEWVFIDTAPSMWVVVTEAIRAATLVLIPARPGLFDLNAVRETVNVSREKNKPYAVVLNAAPVKRDDREAPAVAQSRAFLDKNGIPVWAGQISQRTGYGLTVGLGLTAGEVGPNTAAAVEISRLWTAVERSVAAINDAQLAALAANTQKAQAALRGQAA